MTSAIIFPFILIRINELVSITILGLDTLNLPRRPVVSWRKNVGALLSMITLHAQPEILELYILKTLDSWAKHLAYDSQQRWGPVGHQSQDQGALPEV